MSIGGGKSRGRQTDPAATTLARIAEGFATETAGLRTGLISQLTNILGNPSGQGGFNQADYDTAMRQYESDLASYNAVQAAPTSPTAAQGTPAYFASPPRTREEFLTRMYPQEAPTEATAAVGTPGAAPTAPRREDFYRRPGIQVPIIAQALEATRRASSKVQQETGEELARTGLTGTPFGQRILAESRQAGGRAATDVQTDIMKSLFNIIPNLVLGQAQTATSGLAGAVGGNVSARASDKGLRAGK